MKLIIAVDTSAGSQAVVDEVAARPWPPGVEMRVLHVVDLFSITAGMAYSRRVAEAGIESGEALVRGAADKLAARGLKTSTVVLEGYPRTEIIDHATQWNADFIITGSHGRGAIARFLLGSVAKEVVRTAPCSVEIVRAGEQASGLASKGPMKILAATDGSTSSEVALRSIVARPWPAESEVKVVSVIDATLPAIEPWYGAQQYIDRMDEDRSRMADEAVAAADSILMAAGLRITKLLCEGNPKERIADLAKEWGTDLIVVGSHGKRGLNRVLHGSISEAVAIHAHCSVDIIRRRQ